MPPGVRGRRIARASVSRKGGNSSLRCDSFRLPKPSETAVAAVYTARWLTLGVAKTAADWLPNSAPTPFRPALPFLKSTRPLHILLARRAESHVRGVVGAGAGVASNSCALNRSYQS